MGMNGREYGDLIGGILAGWLGLFFLAGLIVGSLVVGIGWLVLWWLT